jgi:pyruvate ferredoxin oxidoreductase beta subunit
MDNLDVYAVRLVTQKEHFAPGHRACQGCAEALAVRYVAKALGRNAIIVQATGCMEIVASPLPLTSWEIPWIHVAFENAAAVASGIESGLKALMRKGRLPRKQITVVGMAGDGGTSDIGLQALSGALERGHDFIYICTDNEAYMNTGIQRSSATPWGAWTTTTPVRHFKSRPKKDIMRVMAAHKIPYAATATVAYPDDLVAKVQKAKAIRGTRFLHILSPCPPGWKIPSEISIRLARLAIETKIFPLYEIEGGENYTINHTPSGTPVIEYLKLQGRFKHLTKSHMETIQHNVDTEWESLLKRAERGH